MPGPAPAPHIPAAAPCHGLGPSSRAWGVQRLFPAAAAARRAGQGGVRASRARRGRTFLPLRGFTLVEFLFALSLLSFVLLVLFAATEAAGRAWREGQARTENFQSGRTILESIAREAAPAVVDTQSQMVLAPGDVLARVGAPHVAPHSPALLWMAPLGEEGALRCVGYYLYRDEARRFFRLQRLFIAPLTASGKPSPWYPGVSPGSEAALAIRTSPTTADWFTHLWQEAAFQEEDGANDQAVVSAVADGVLGFWVRGIDLLGRPIPLASQSKVHPPTTLAFNSAAYFQMATTIPFASGESFLYQAKTEQTMKANRLPAALELTVVTLDQASLARRTRLPEQTEIVARDGTLDIAASCQEFRRQLAETGLSAAQVFTTRVRLLNGN